MSRLEDQIYGRLRLFNLAMGTLHLLQGATMLFLSSDFTLPLRTTFLDSDPQGEEIVTLTNTVFDLRLGPLVAVFLLISAAAHYLLASPVVYPWYVKNLRKHINYVRWYEYALSSSVMIVVIAMLSGMFDLPSLVLLFALNATMIFFGLMMELHNQTTDKTNWTSFNLGVFAGIVPWVVIFWYFSGAVANSEDAVPKFVYGIIASLFVFFNVFAVNMVLQYRKIGPWRDYLFGERMYILLSLFAKSALAWQVFSGTLRG
ncbi:MAG: heliorhodopsin HeR [Dehalococcoidia bacterium]|nr:MAG: heliorhodopsin HeR [Dehalococcoidia bacterium]